MNPEVCCVNTSALVAYIREIKGQPGIDQLLTGVENIDEAYLTDTNNWISLDVLFQLFHNIQILFAEYNPAFFFELGKQVSATQGSALISLAKWLGSTRDIINSSPSFNRRFNVDQEIELVSVGRARSTIINYFLPEFFGREKKHQCEWTKGIFSGIPMLWNLPPARVHESICSFKLQKMLVEEYAYLDLDIDMADGVLFVDGVEHARKVILEEMNADKALFEEVRGLPPGFARGSKRILNGHASDAGTEGNHHGYLVTKTLAIDGERIIKKGQIYNAPYCLYELEWQGLSLYKNIHNRTVGRLQTYFASREELEQLLLISERRLFETAAARDELAELNQSLELTVEQRTKEYKEEKEKAERVLAELESTQAHLLEVEKARRIYQVRAAQADAVARFLHQTSNLVLQPLASTMIVFEDFIDIIEDCKSEWAQSLSDEDLYQELDGSLTRVKETYPATSQVIDGYRKLFHAFYEVYVSTEPVRDFNQDLRFIETLVRNKYILTNVELELDLDPNVPKMKLEGGVQSIFLEFMHNAAKHGAKHIRATTKFDGTKKKVEIRFYNDGDPIIGAQWVEAKKSGVDESGGGFGIHDAYYIVTTLNNGQIRSLSSDVTNYNVLILIEFTSVAN